ncbi:MAG: hypothetical protein ACHQPH_00315 [Reyranellales bacterium]
MNWLSAVPRHLLERAYEARDEYAWSRCDAIDVIEALQGRNFKVIGVEVWLPTKPGPTIPTPYIYVWDIGSENGSAGHPIHAIDFIRTFVWSEQDLAHRDREPYFNLTVVAAEALLPGFQLAIFEVIWPTFRWIRKIWVTPANNLRFYVEIATAVDPEKQADFERLFGEIMDVGRDYFPNAMSEANHIQYGVEPPSGYREIFSDAIFRQIAQEHAPWRLAAGR